jgi:hypothetical protein
MKDSFWTSEKMIGLAALFTSILTLIFFVYEITLTRKQSYAAVYPALYMQNAGSFTSRYSLIIRNKGVGPAIISDVSIHYNGAKFDELNSYLNDRIRKNYKNDRDSINYMFSSMSSGDIISPGEEIELVVTPNKKSSDVLVSLINDEHLKIEIKYKSIYDEEWVTTLGGKPIKID